MEEREADSPVDVPSATDALGTWYGQLPVLRTLRGSDSSDTGSDV